MFLGVSIYHSLFVVYALQYLFSIKSRFSLVEHYDETKYLRLYFFAHR